MCRECVHHREPGDRCRELQRERLRRVYLFEGLPEPQFRSLLDHMAEVELEHDQWLCLLGEPAKNFYLVLEGDVALVRTSADGDDLIVAILGPGELFGEDLMYCDEPVHPLSVRALSASRLASFGCERSRLLLEADSELALKVLRTVQRRNVMLLEELEQLTVQDASARLLSFLERQAALHGPVIPLRFPKRVLASRLSIRPETLSRVLARLKDCHRIREEGGSLIVADQEAGCALCETCPARHWGCPGPRPEAGEEEGAWLRRTA
ncbi:MAG: Crp/Fnr family transcriptional regulator [Thermoanaerobaculia bacterium]|nr:Crp/Fnr family transcriptional regulator [Thermoanaerobaculia bacterium]